MKILMCRPNYYGINYVINPWMNLEKKVNLTLAVEQWDMLYQTLLSCGATIDLVKPILGLPDMVFTANAGLLYQNKMILSHFKHKERQGEEKYFKSWFEQHGFVLLNTHSEDELYFEGAGDALPAGKTLFAAYGFRTSLHFYEQANYLDPTHVVYCQLVDPYFYHLDTCFCPLTDHLAIWYPPAFDSDSQKRILNHIDLITVNEKEAKQFACNSVVLEKTVIIPKHCPELTTSLEKEGFNVQSCEVSEYIKAGGACKCLTLRID